MARYILIDNNSGYIWGDSADLEGEIFTGSPTEYANALDESLGEFGREYEMLTRTPRDNSTGYRVFDADVRGSEAVTVVTDGQDQEMIDAVERDCYEVGFIKISAAA